MTLTQILTRYYEETKAALQNENLNDRQFHLAISNAYAKADRDVHLLRYTAELAEAKKPS